MAIKYSAIIGSLGQTSDRFMRMGYWCATRQVDNEKNIKFLCCPVCAGQYFYAANNRS